MTDELTVAVCQPLVISHDVAGNAERHAAAVTQASARLVVFPELSLTGYELEAEPVSPDDERLASIVDACATTGALALVGAPTRGGRGDHISFLAIDHRGVHVAYSKLFLGGDEPGRFSPGTEPTLIDVDGWRVGLGICKDTGVAEHADRTAALGIDVYAAGVCEHDRDVEVTAERARRIAADHDVWVAMASFAGPTGGGYIATAGGSGVWRRDGSIAARAGSEPGESARAIVDRAHLTD